MFFMDGSTSKILQQNYLCKTYDEIQTSNPLKLKLGPMGSCADAESAESLKPVPPVFIAKKEGPKDFTKNVDESSLKKL